MTKKNITIILGPTASGKSNLALEKAEKVSGEIISADAYQVYRGMDIGTAKVSKEEQARVPHHLIDICDPKDTFSVSDFHQHCSEVVSELKKRDTPIFICGGTGLYLSSFIYGYTYDTHEKSNTIREELEHIHSTEGLRALTDILERIDDKSKSFVDFQNPRRVIRAIERYRLTQKKPSELETHNTAREDITLIGIQWDRATLIDRINERVDQMVKQGLIDEVQHLLRSGVTPDMPSMKALGYKETILFLEGSIAKEEMIELIKVKTRQFSKRQMTWFRRFENINWIHPS